MRGDTFEANRYVPTEFRQGEDVFQSLEGQLRRWLDGKAREPAARVFVLGGWPGIGKSWLLHHISGRRRGQYECRYLDLDEGRRASARWSFVRRARKLVAGVHRPLCLLVDHVPRRSSDWLWTIEEEVLVPLLFERNGFLVLATPFRQWGLGTVPHLPAHKLGLLNEEGRKRLLQKTGCRQEYREEALTVGGGHPYLMMRICQDGMAQGCRSFLEYWLERWEWEDERRETLYDAAFRALELGDVSQAAKRLLRRVGWVELVKGEGGQYEDRWVPPVQQALEALRAEEEASQVVEDAYTSHTF